jgi:lysophospholipase L1-like esterase
VPGRESPNAGSRLLLVIFAPAPLLLAFAVDEVVALGRGFEPSSRLETVALALAFAVVALAALALLAGKGRAVARRHAKLLIGLNALLLLGLDGAEIGLSREAARVGRTQFHRRLPNTHALFKPDPDLYTGASFPVHYTTSSLGIRGPELPATRGEAYRLLCVGGSTTECLSIDDAKTWPALVGSALATGPARVWVGNVGISGFASHEHLRFARESELMEQVDAIVVLCGGNDLQSALVARSGGAPPFWRRSELFQWASTGQVHGFLPFMYDVGIFDPTLSMLRQFREPRRHATFTDALPELGPALAAYASRIKEIAALARARSVVPVFATQPTLAAKSLPPDVEARCWHGWLDEGRTRFLTGGRYREAIDRTNETLLRASEGVGAGCVDLSPLNGREDCFEDEFHFTETGARAVAELVSKWLIDHKIPPR